MAVDVETDIVIKRPRSEVSAYAADPDNAPHWYSNIQQVEWETPKPLSLGSRIAFEASFLGRTLSYIYEVIDLEPGRRLVMSTKEGPFPMETTYSWEDAPEGATRMRLRNQGSPSGFSSLAAPLLARQMRKANEADLRALKRVLESGETPPD